MTAAAAAAAAAGESLRIHVGGLRTNVTEEEMVKTFSSLGRVSRVAFVSRPEGQSFAYMDFEPASDKSLAKLFASYNGCTWKGGKLRLEKAKEFYLDRLKREWAEAAEIIKNDQEAKDCKEKESQVLWKPKSLTDVTTQLQMFFPKLNKMKKLPFKGTGKHKYSFQRVDVPTLPVHFCDCEEHCRPFVPAGDRKVVMSNNVKGGMEEKERNIMNSVLKKFVGEEIVDEGISTTQENIVKCSADPHVFEQEETEEADENFVMNIGIGEDNSMLDLLQAKRKLEVAGIQDAKNDTSNELISDKKISHKRQKTEVGNRLEVLSETNSSKAKSSKNSIKPGKKKVPDNFVQEVQDSPNTATDQCQSHQSAVTILPADAPSWKQKASWKKLLGDAEAGKFTVSHLLPRGHSKMSNSSKLFDAICEDQKVTTQSVKDHPKHLEVETIQNEIAVEVESSVAKKSKNKHNPDVREDGHRDGNTNDQSLIPTAGSQIQHEELHRPQKTPDEVPANVARGSSWLHQSSWTTLVKDIHATTFSISQVIPDVDQLYSNLPQTCDLAISNAQKDENVASQSEGVVPKEVSDTKKTANRPSIKETSKEVGVTSNSDENSHHTVEQKHVNPQNNAPPIVLGQVCTFMRNADSKKQWSKAKAAVHKQMNKINKSTASKSSKKW